jgi:hypothetical protein
LIVIGLACLCAAPLPAQEQDREWYTVSGERHGVSYFARHQHPEVEYEAGDVLSFDRYHTMDVMYTWLKRWAEEYPNLVELYEVGRSFEGRPILQVTLTNQETGAATDKPAAFFEGGRHSGEVTSSESVLWLMQHLLEGYGHDDEITELLDTKTIYLKPKNNPDGSNMYLHTAQRNRSSVRPHDSDRDGLIDEDPNEDLDGDGVIYSLRWRARPDEQEEANLVLDERDPSGRLMKRARVSGWWRARVSTTMVTAISTRTGSAASTCTATTRRTGDPIAAGMRPGVVTPSSGRGRSRSASPRHGRR